MIDARSNNDPAQLVDMRRSTVIRLVLNGVENDSIECKREWNVKRESRSSQLSFVKLVQSIANTPRSSEGYLVIGADSKAKVFCNVTNAEHFDPADISKLINSYLDPPPNIEIYNNLTTDDGIKFVLVTFHPEQNRPIVLIKDGESDGVRIRTGEVWVKSSTATSMATRRQLDEMFEERADRYAEALARKRFAHFKEENDLVRSSVVNIQRPPQRDIILGPRGDLVDYFLTAVESGNGIRIRMLIEMLRDILVVEWAAFEGGFGSGTFAANTDSFREFVANGVTPAVIALTEIAILVIKHQLDSAIANKAVGVLREHFESTAIFAARGLNPRITADVGFPAWFTCMQCYAGVRIAALYALTRDRKEYLPVLQCHFVTKFSNVSSNYGRMPVVPFQFIPFYIFDSPDLLKREGTIRYLWEIWAKEYFEKYFVGFDGYLSAALIHEVILEFNSFVAQGLGDTGTIKFGVSRKEGVNFDYRPEFWRWSDERLANAFILLNKLAEQDTKGGFESIMLVSDSKPLWNNINRELRCDLVAKFTYRSLNDATDVSRQQGDFFFAHDLLADGELNAIYKRGKSLVDKAGS